jgi:hypothetical protein
MVDIFSALFAIKAPGLQPGVLDMPVEVQSALAHYLGARESPMSEAPGHALVGDPSVQPFGTGYRKVRLPALFHTMPGE